MEVENTCPQDKLLLSLCNAILLRILNGRCLGDSCGSFTRYPFRTKGLIENPSVIDYGLANPQLLERVRYFRVADLKSLVVTVVHIYIYTLYSILFYSILLY